MRHLSKLNGLPATFPVIAACLAAMLPLAREGRAQSVWSGGTGDYNTAGNWTPSGVPAETTPIVISSGTATITGNDGAIRFGRAADATINGGDLVLDNARFLNGFGGAATFTLSSGSVTQNNSTYFIVAQNNSGTLEQTGGTITSTNLSRGFFLSDSSAMTTANTSGTYNLFGGSLDVTMTGDPQTDAYNVFVGKAGPNDTLFIDGGSATFREARIDKSVRRVYVSRNSEVRVDSGSLTVDDFQYFSVGRAGAPNDVGKLTINGGVTNLNLNTAMPIGNGTSGLVEITAGTLNVNAVNGSGGEVWINDGSGALSAEVRQSGGVFTIENDLILGRNPTSATAGNIADYVMDGGSLSARSILQAQSNGRFFFNGGLITLTLPFDQSSILNEPWFNAPVGTTAVFDGTVTTLTAVPEPAALGLVAAATAIAGWGLGRRR
jgi:hypothetical protein